jgi:hypothetical protein
LISGTFPAARRKDGDTMLSPTFWHVLIEPAAGTSTAALLAKYALQLVVICRARKEDLPQIARAIWKRRRSRHR